MAKILKVPTDKAAEADAAKAEETVKKVKAKTETVADTAPEPKPKKAKAAAKEGAPSRFVGITSGMRVLQYQNHSLVQNAKKKATDEVVAADWRREFPRTIARYSADTVNGVRNLFNLGKHGNNKPAVPLLQYDESGKPVPPRAKAERRKKAAPVAASTKKAKADAPPTPDTPAPRLKKIKRSA